MKLTKFLALTALMLPAIASAQFIQTQNFDFTPNGNQTMTFNKVNVDIANVTAIIVTVTLNKTGGSLAVDNDSTSSGNLEFSHTLQGALTSSNSIIDGSFSTAWANLNAASSTTQNVGVTSGDPTNQFNVTAFSDYYEFTPGTVSNSTGANLASAIWSQYLGASGTYTMTFTANQLASVTGFGGLQQAFTVSQASGSVTVEVVPEPATFGLLASGGLVMLLASRRRRNS